MRTQLCLQVWPGLQDLVTIDPHRAELQSVEDLPLLADDPPPPRPGTAAPVKAKAAALTPEQAARAARAAQDQAMDNDVRPYVVIKEEDTEEQRQAKKTISFAGTQDKGKRSARGPAMSLLVFPLTFMSSAYVPVDSLPGWMQPLAENQPITAMVNAVRALALGGADAAHLAHSTAHWVVLSLLWSAGIVLAFAPLAVARYRSSTR